MYAPAMRLSASDTQCLLIDVQARLLPAMCAPAQVVARGAILLRAAEALGIPVLITEQYSRGLGPTVPELRDAAGAGAAVMEKMHFSAYAELPIRAAITARDDRRQIVLAGIEAHVCVLQSALDLQQAGFQVFVVADAISSRAPASVALAESRMTAAGISLVNTEMCVFEWLGQAGHPQFRALSALIR